MIRNRTKSFSRWQLATMALATVAPSVIVGAVLAAVAGVLDTEQMIGMALEAGENPGIITFGAMFLATPIQWLTGRTQVRVRKYLGICFSLLAISNGAMFALETGGAGVESSLVSRALAEPFLVAGSLALLLTVPLLATSSRWSQRAMGMARWRLLHKLTYVIALALMAHVLFIGDIGPGFVMIAAGFVARIPTVSKWLRSRRSKDQPGGDKPARFLAAV